MPYNSQDYKINTIKRQIQFQQAKRDSASQIAVGAIVISGGLIGLGLMTRNPVIMGVSAIASVTTFVVGTSMTAEDAIRDTTIDTLYDNLINTYEDKFNNITSVTQDDYSSYTNETISNSNIDSGRSSKNRPPVYQQPPQINYPQAYPSQNIPQQQQSQNRRTA